MVRGAGMLAAVFLALAGGGAWARTPPDGLVWIAVRDVNEAWDNDREPTNRPPVAWTVPEGMIRPVDVTRDGVADWVLDYSASGAGDYCGSGGCLTRLYVSVDGRHLAVLDRQTDGLVIAERDGETVIEAEVHHLNCEVGARDCRFAWAWDAATGRLQPRIPSNGATRLVEGGAQPMEFIADDADILPPALSQQWYGGRTTCRDYSDDGLVVLRPRIAPIPDVTGDGLPDWMLVQAGPCDTELPSPGFSIWADDGAGDAREVHVSAYDRVGLIDIATRPAVLIEQQGCGYDPQCVETRLHWDAGAGRFVAER